MVRAGESSVGRAKTSIVPASGTRMLGGPPGGRLLVGRDRTAARCAPATGAPPIPERRGLTFAGGRGGTWPVRPAAEMSQYPVQVARAALLDGRCERRSRHGANLALWHCERQRQHGLDDVDR